MYKKNILTLIEDNIVNYKLISTLSNLGIEASAYSVNSAYVIFDLLGFTDKKRREVLHHEYNAMLRNASNFDVIENREELNRFATQIYNTLSKVNKCY